MLFAVFSSFLDKSVIDCYLSNRQCVKEKKYRRFYMADTFILLPSKPNTPQLRKIIQKAKSQTPQMPAMRNRRIRTINKIPIIHGVTRHQTPKRHRHNPINQHFGMRCQTSRHTTHPHDDTRKPHSPHSITRAGAQIPHLIIPREQIP